MAHDRRPARWGLALALAVACAGITMAQPPPRVARFTQLSLDEGLVQSTVPVAIQGRRGLVYLATQRGVLRFDGYDFVAIDPGGGLDTSISALAEVDGEHLLIGTFTQGLGWLDLLNGRLRHLTSRSEIGRLRSDEICAVEPSSGGHVWIGSSIGVDRLELSTGTTTPVDLDGLGPACALEESADGALWIGRGGALLRYDITTGDVRRHVGDPADPGDLGGPDGSGDKPQGRIHTILEGHSRSLYLGTERGIVRVDPGGHDDNSLIPTPSAVLSMAEDATGRLWIGTRRGLLQVDPRRGSLRRVDGRVDGGVTVDHDAILSVMVDRSGLVWLGTLSRGVLHYDPGQHRFRGLTAASDGQPGLSHPIVWAMAEDADGSLFVATGGGGVDHFDAETGAKRTFRHQPGRADSLSTDRVRSLLRSRDGSLLIGGFGGEVDRLEPTTGRVERWGSLSPGPVDAPIRSLVEDGVGRIWVASWGAGLARVAESPRRGFVPMPDARTRLVHGAPDAGRIALADWPAAARRVAAMVEDDRGVLWLATDGAGLHSVSADRRTVTVFRHRPGDPASLMTDDLLALTLGSAGRLWLGTNRGELASFDRRSHRCTSIGWRDQRPDLERSSIYSIIEDARQRLWLGTNGGLVRFDPATGEARRFDPRDGMVNPELNAGAALVSRTTGDLLFGGTLGVDRFRPDALARATLPSAITLTSVRSGNRHLYPRVAAPATEYIELRPRDRDVLFEFAAVDYRHPRRNRYAYRLVGQDAGWVDAGTRRVAAYSNLPGGEYTFQVRAANSRGVWNQEGLALRVRVVPPFWRTNGFRLAVVSLVVLVAMSIPIAWARRRLAKIARHRREETEARRRLLAAREQERARLARELHDGPLQALATVRQRLFRASRRDGAFAAIDAIDEMASDLRALCGELRPSALVEGGLTSAIELFLASFAEHHPEIAVESELMVHDKTPVRPEGVQLFRIAQEAFANIIQHADATAVVVRLELDAEGTRLEIEDDGRGFTVPDRWIEFGRRERYGLLGMAERAMLIGARLDVESRPGAGTVIRVTVPEGAREDCVTGSERLEVAGG